MTNYERNKLWFRIFGGLYAIPIVLFVVSVILPLDFYRIQFYAIFGGWIGFSHICISLILAVVPITTGAIVTGYLGCIGIGVNWWLNYIFHGVFYSINLMADYVLFASMIGCVVVMGGLLFFKEIDIDRVKHEYFIMDQDKLRFRIIGLMYLVFAAFFIVSAFLEFVPSLYGYTPSYAGMYYLWYGGWVGFAFIALSFIMSLLVRLRTAINAGIIGTVLIGINVGIYFITFSVGVVTCLMAFAGFLIITISLHLYAQPLYKRVGGQRIVPPV